MSKLVRKSPSVCTDLPLDNCDIRNKLHILVNLLRSCFGPRGRLKQIHNNIGGHVVTTSTSSLLLQSVSSSQPFINVILSSIRSHVARFSDSGLFAAILCLTLIDLAHKSGLKGTVAIGVNRHLLGLCIGYLRQKDCGCSVKLDLNSSSDLIKLSRSVLSSKAACGLTEHEVFHISKLAVRAFLLSVPCSGQSGPHATLGEVVTVLVEGPSVLESAVFPGLLVDLPDGFDATKVDNRPPYPLCIVLFSISLAGDLSEVGDGTVETDQGVDTESQILENLMEIGENAVKENVKLFVCQKVIHPVLQQYLRSHGIVVIERLGISLMRPLALLTGAQPVATLHSTIPPRAFGKVGNFSSRQFASKTMVHLYPAEESVICTMVLCHRNETMLNELKVVFQRTEHVLRLALQEPVALLGGGCTETHLAAYIRHQSTKDMVEAASVIGCLQTEYRLGVEAFCSSLESVATALDHNSGFSLIDLTCAHHWILPADGMNEDMEDSLGLCGCGMLDRSPSKKWSHLNTKYPEFSPASLSEDSPLQPCVLDSFTAKINALQVAVETANIALDVQYIIQDMN